MNRTSRNISATITLVTSFAGVAGICLYMGYKHGQDNSNQEAFEAGYQAFQDELTACKDANKAAGEALGDYILGENNVSEADLDTAELEAEELCAKFEL